MVDFHEKSVSKALCELFPHLNFQLAKFSPPKPGTNNYYNLFNVLILAIAANWGNVQGRRDFFLKFAKFYGFDPLEPENWYSVSKRNIVNFKVK